MVVINDSCLQIWQLHQFKLVEHSRGKTSTIRSTGFGFGTRNFGITTRTAGYAKQKRRGWSESVTVSVYTPFIWRFDVTYCQIVQHATQKRTTWRRFIIKVSWQSFHTYYVIGWTAATQGRIVRTGYQFVTTFLNRLTKCLIKKISALTVLTLLMTFHLSFSLLVIVGNIARVERTSWLTFDYFF